MTEINKCTKLFGFIPRDHKFNPKMLICERCGIKLSDLQIKERKKPGPKPGSKKVKSKVIKEEPSKERTLQSFAPIEKKKHGRRKKER